MAATAGRKAKPAGLKLIEGRSPGRDSGGRLVKSPPAFKRVPPTPPAWLSDLARAEWDRVLPELVRLDLTKDLDAMSLAAYCESVALLAISTQQVQAEGLTIVNHGKDGAEWTTTNPAVGLQLKAMTQLRSWATEFGFTPSAEQKVSKAEVTNGDEEDNPFGS